MRNLPFLVIGIGFAAMGGEFFVRGVVGLATWARVPAGIIGATLAAFATSAPELSVGIQSAAAERPELALGDALGSNVVNIALVLGVVLLLGPLHASRLALRRELAFAAAAPVLTLIALVDGRLTRAEAIVLLLVFITWFTAISREALHERASAGDFDGAPAGWRTISALVAGLIALIIAGRLIVSSAREIGTDLGLDPFVIGATLVAVGTSVPELATAVIARRRGHSGVGVETVLGSNVFNNLWVVGIVALIRPVGTSASEVILSVGTCLVALLLVFPNASGHIPRWRGGVLLTMAAGYAAATVALGP